MEKPIVLRVTPTNAEGVKEFLKDYTQCNLAWNGNGKALQQMATWIRNTFDINVVGYNSTVEPNTIIIEYQSVDAMTIYESIKVKHKEK
jgi:hypothetical protein